MTNLVRAKFQAHPFHLVEPSPWPLVASFALLTLTVSGVMTMHGYAFGGYLSLIGFLSVLGTMIFWFRDIIAEGTYVPSINSTICWKNFSLMAKRLSQSAGNLENRILRDYALSSETCDDDSNYNLNDINFNSYLAGFFF
jgi:hypothetical protein